MPIAIFSDNTAATTEAVAAKTGYRIRVTGYRLAAAGTVTVTFKSASTAISAPIYCVAGVPHQAGAANSYDAVKLFETNAGEALNLTLSGAVAVGAEIYFDYVA